MDNYQKTYLLNQIDAIIGDKIKPVNFRSFCQIKSTETREKLYLKYKQKQTQNTEFLTFARQIKDAIVMDQANFNPLEEIKKLRRWKLDTRKAALV